MKKRANEERLRLDHYLNARGGCTRCKCATVRSESIPTQSLSSCFYDLSYGRGILNDLIQDGSFVSEGWVHSALSPIDFSKEDYEEMMSMIEDEFEYQCSQLGGYSPSL